MVRFGGMTNPFQGSGRDELGGTYMGVPGARSPKRARECRRNIAKTVRSTSRRAIVGSRLLVMRLAEATNSSM